MVGIYSITNPSGKVYIGQSWQIQIRRRRYKNYECKGQVRIFNSLRKYGWEQHVFTLLHLLPNDIDQAVLNDYEKLYYEQFKYCGIELLNIREPGSNGKLSDESKKKISEKHMGKKLSLKTRKKMSASRMGRRYTKIIKYSQETLKKLSDSCPNKKIVLQYTKDGVFVATFKSRAEASKTTNVNSCHISECCNGIRKTAGGYIWR